MHRDDGVEIFGAPILFRGRFGGRVGPANLLIAADFAARLRKVIEDRPEMRRKNAAVDQQRLGRSADAGAAHLGVQDQRARFGEIGPRVHISVADAFEMREHGHTRLRLPKERLP
jgi:hypothetical protein